MVVVAFAIVPHSFSQMVLFLLSIAQLEHLFNKPGRQTAAVKSARLAAG
jgi:hypothetical protein